MLSTTPEEFLRVADHLRLLARSGGTVCRKDGGVNYDIIPETWQEALQRWDAGQPVFTVEMGGLGPGYEQCIQALVFELLRDCGDKPLPKKGDRDGWYTWGDATVSRLNETFGFSGAQVGAAKNLASVVMKQGYRKALRSVPEERLIQASKRFPVPA